MNYTTTFESLNAYLPTSSLDPLLITEWLTDAIFWWFKLEFTSFLDVLLFEPWGLEDSFEEDLYAEDPIDMERGSMFTEK